MIVRSRQQKKADILPLFRSNNLRSNGKELTKSEMAETQQIIIKRRNEILGDPLKGNNAKTKFTRRINRMDQEIKKAADMNARRHVMKAGTGLISSNSIHSNNPSSRNVQLNVNTASYNTLPAIPILPESPSPCVNIKKRRQKKHSDQNSPGILSPALLKLHITALRPNHSFDSLKLQEPFHYVRPDLSFIFRKSNDGSKKQKKANNIEKGIITIIDEEADNEK